MHVWDFDELVDVTSWYIKYIWCKTKLARITEFMCCHIVNGSFDYRVLLNVKVNYYEVYFP